MDNVNHPKHYNVGNFECIEVMENVFGCEAVMNFCLCNAFKYMFRCEHKQNKHEDIEKAVWYLNKWISLNTELVK